MPDQTAIIARMNDLVRSWQRESDRRAIFLNCYMLMTGNMLVAIDASEFRDAVWVNRLLHCFADYYFDALETYENGAHSTPAVWERAFAASHLPNIHVLQHLLLGVNAHINYDLVLTLVEMLESEWELSSKDHRNRRYADHCHVNAIIGQTIDAVQDQVIEIYSPEMDMVDNVFGRLDEWMISRLITRWREEVWQNAVQLLEAGSPVEREAVRWQVEAAALKRAGAILLQTSPGSLISLL